MKFLEKLKEDSKQLKNKKYLGKTYKNSGKKYGNFNKIL